MNYKVLEHTKNIFLALFDLRQLHFSSLYRHDHISSLCKIGINHTLFGHHKGYLKTDNREDDFGSHTDLRPCLCIKDDGLCSILRPDNPYFDIPKYKYIFQAGPTVIQYREFGVATKYEKFDSSFIHNKTYTSSGNHLVVGNTATGKLLICYGKNISLTDICHKLCNNKCHYAMLCDEHIYFHFEDDNHNIHVGKTGYGLNITTQSTNTEFT